MESQWSFNLCFSDDWRDPCTGCLCYIVGELSVSISHLLISLFNFSLFRVFVSLVY